MPRQYITNAGEIDDAYICPVCSGLLRKPVECHNCRRIFCKRCIDRWLKEKPGICPICKHYKEDKCSPVFYGMLCRVKITCKNRQNGCNDVLSYESLEKHQKEQCEYRMEACHGCQDNILRKDLNQHTQNCPEIKIECKRCGLLYQRKEEHPQMDCMKYTIDQQHKRIRSLERNRESMQKDLERLRARVDFDFSRGLPLSIVHHVPLSSLYPSWTKIYDYPYSHVTTVEELRTLRLKCNRQIIVGAIQGRLSNLLEIAAMGPSEILSLDSPLNQPTAYGDISWYLTPKSSFGFAPSSTSIYCAYADCEREDNAENRLSWHLCDVGGYRAGAVMNLNSNKEWRKIIMTECNN